MSITYFGEVHFIAFGSVSTILSDGVIFPSSVFFEGTTGGWSLLDALTIYGATAHNGGALTINGNTVSVAQFIGYSPGSLHLGDSDFYVQASLARFGYAPADFEAGTSHIICNSASLEGNYYSPTVSHFYDVSFYGSGGNGFAFGSVGGTLTFHDFGLIHSYFSNNTIPELNNVIFEQDGLIYNANDYNNLTLTAGKTYTIQNYSGTTGTDQTILPGGTLTALGAGTCDQFITIKSWQYGTHFNFVNNSGATQTVHCAILEDCHATGSDPLEVLDGVDLGNNTGWIFTDPHGDMDLYWIGGAGDWNDFNHWSETDGGPAGTCIPNGATNVYFTANSGFTPGDQVIVPIDAYCNDMNWTGVTGEPEIYHLIGGTSNLHIYGSVTLDAGMNFNFGGVTHFRTDNVSTIKSASNEFKCEIVFEGTGTWMLQDSFKNLDFSICHKRGTFRTLGHPMIIYQWLGNWKNCAYPDPSNMGAELDRKSVV